MVHTCVYDVYKQQPSLNRISHYSFNILLGHAMLICPSTVDYWSNCHFFLLWADNRGVATKKPVCEHGKWVDITILLCFSYIKSDTTAISHATCKKNDLGNSMMNQSYTKNVTINCTKREGKKKVLPSWSSLFLFNALFLPWLLKRSSLGSNKACGNEVINKLRSKIIGMISW